MSTYVPKDLSLYAGLHPQKVPTVWYPIYVVYQYAQIDRTYIVGFDSDVAAGQFQKELLDRKQGSTVVRAEVFGHYPLELLK